MFGDLLGSIIDKEKMVYDTIQEALENLTEELQCSHSDLFIMIKPYNEELDFKCYVYKIESGKNKIVREISIKEILGG